MTTPSTGDADTLVRPDQTQASNPAVSADAIRPFEFHASDEDLADLKRRILATRWPDRETVTDDSQGVQLATMEKLAAYWANEYDWRKCEARLNARMAVRSGLRWSTTGPKRMVGAVGGSFMIRPRFWLDGHFSQGGTDELRAFSLALRAGM